MNDEQRLIYVRGMLLQAEIEMQAMIAENKIRESEGNAPAYGEQAFMDLIERINELCGR